MRNRQELLTEEGQVIFSYFTKSEKNHSSVSGMDKFTRLRQVFLKYVFRKALAEISKELNSSRRDLWIEKISRKRTKIREALV